MIRILAVVLAAAFIAAPDLADAQGKSNDATSASRFGISVDGVQKPKAKGLKSSSGKGSGTKGPKLENAWPKKGY